MSLDTFAPVAITRLGEAYQFSPKDFHGIPVLFLPLLPKSNPAGKNILLNNKFSPDIVPFKKNFP